jgi:glycosyltransferase involved in cell wall biosynthesis
LKVLHVIVGLNIGGAESMLQRLIQSAAAGRADVVVVSLTTVGVIGESLRSHGVTVYALGMSGLLDFPLTLWRLVRLIHRHRPQVVQTWLYHADLLGGLAARLAGSCGVVWGIRSTTIPQGPLSLTFWLVRLCAICSHFIPDRIICCAQSAKAAHLALGFAANKMMVIPNGYDFSLLVRDTSARERTRLDLGFEPDEIVIGVVGRFDPLKGLRDFVDAATELATKRKDARFLMVGRGLDWSNAVLRDWIESGGLASVFRLVGEQGNVPNYLAAMEIFCLSSINEGFPNVVVEAMALGLPCVVTSAGDAADILGDNGLVVPTRSPGALCEALLKMCNLSSEERGALGERGRNKVRADYDIEDIKRQYDEVYVEATSNC